MEGPLEDSKVFCMLPWVHMNVATDGRVLACCVADWNDPLGSVRTASLEQLWNSPGLRQMRLNMLEGRQSPQCRYCYRLEEGGFPSVRQIANGRFGRRLEWVRQTRPDGGLDRLRMPFMDIRFSNVCNFRCRTCSPDVSSSWYDDAAKLGQAPEHPKILTPTADPDDLWRQIERLVPDLEEVYFAGGEPLLSEEHYRILDLLALKRLFGVRIRYSTNLSVMTYRGRDVMALWDKFESVMVSASLDGTGRRGEYLRAGMSWEQALRNRERMAKVCPRAEFSVAPVVGLMNALHIADFHQEWLERGLVEPGRWYLQMLVTPEEYSLQALPTAAKRKVAERYERHIETVLRPAGAEGDAALYRGALGFMAARDQSALLPAFWERTRRLDELRGEDFGQSFPETASLLRSES